MVPPKNEPEPYVYTKLNDIKVGRNFNVYGILVEVRKEPTATARGTLHSIYHIKDETLPPNEVFRMNCFSHSVPPPSFSVGEILRFHRVKVEHAFNDSCDGRVFKATDIASFSSDCTSGFEHKSASSDITFTDADKARISELREIAQLETCFGDSQLSGMNISSILQSENNGVGQPKNGNNDERQINGNNDERQINGNNDERQINENNNMRQASVKKESVGKKLLPNPFHESNQKNRSCSSSELDVSSEKKEINSKRKASITENITVRKKPKACPLSKKKIVSDEQPSSSRQRVDEHVSSTAAPSPRVKVLKETPNKLLQRSSKDAAETRGAEEERSKSPVDFGADDVQNEVGDADTQTINCPGIICAKERCGQTPILIDSQKGISDIHLRDMGGEIPAADDQGNIMVRTETHSHFKVEEKKTYINANFMENFNWPSYCVKVRITAFKPNLKVLMSHSPKNLLSGVCLNCNYSSFYSRLQWIKCKDSATKRAVCQQCNIDGDIRIQFKLRMTVTDAWGTDLNVYVHRDKVSKFLGCTVAEYQRSPECRQKTIEILTSALKSKQYLNINITCVNTKTAKHYYVCGEELSSALINAKK